jgi:hypothetical protein
MHSHIVGALGWPPGRAAHAPGVAAVAVLFLMALVAHPGVGVAQTVVGDANCDGATNSADVGALAGAVFVGNSDCSTADVNGDGRLTAPDFVALSRALVNPTPTATTTSVATATATMAISPAATATNTAIVPSSPTATRTNVGTPAPTAR